MNKYYQVDKFNHSVMTPLTRDEMIKCLAVYHQSDLNDVIAKVDNGGIVRTVWFYYTSVRVK